MESTDDAINVTGGAFTINGGKIYCNASANDGIDINPRTGGRFVMNGGLVVTVGAGNPEEGLDIDAAQYFTMTGGTIIAVGGAQMAYASNASTSTQPLVLWKTTQTFSAGELVSLKPSSGGAEVFSYKMPRAYSGGSSGGGGMSSGGTGILFSSADLKTNTQYAFHKGGSVSGGTEFQGLYTGASSSGGTSVTTYTQSTVSHTISTSSR